MTMSSVRELNMQVKEEAIFLQEEYTLSVYSREEMINNKQKLYELGGTLPTRRTRKTSSTPTSKRRSVSLEDAERAHIVSALEECGWKVRGKGGAAERLGLKRTTLQSRMKKLGIERPTI